MITLIGIQDLKKNLSRQKKMEVKIIAEAKKKKYYLIILQNHTGSQHHGIFTDHIQQQPTVPCINWAGVRKKTAHSFLLLWRTLLYPHLECCTQLLSLSPERSGGARDSAKKNCKDHRALQAERPRTPQAWRENAREDMTESYKSITW